MGRCGAPPLSRWGPRRKVTGQQAKFATDPTSYRSGLEEKTAAFLHARGVKFTFEKVILRFTEPAKPRKYTPDFVLENGIVIETKGYFLSKDRQKHILVQAQHPDIDLRFVFSQASKPIAKKSKTTYAKWAEDHGFKWADKTIPEEWLKEAANDNSLEALKEITG